MNMCAHDVAEGAPPLIDIVASAHAKVQTMCALFDCKFICACLRMYVPLSTYASVFVFSHGNVSGSVNIMMSMCVQMYSRLYACAKVRKQGHCDLRTYMCAHDLNETI